jgi:hypothetical protein
MGCRASAPVKFTNAHRDEVLIRFNAIRLALGFTEEEIWKLYQVFVEMNKTESGSVSMDEMMEYLDFDGGPFSQRAFKIYKDTTNGISECLGGCTTVDSRCLCRAQAAMSASPRQLPAPP